MYCESPVLLGLYLMTRENIKAQQDPGIRESGVGDKTCRSLSCQDDLTGTLTDS
jgi:hypothetical protein